jgi:Na+-transporting methylmalonyl-CoA/oxaloacetate decarboxylase gamma subunit
MERSSNEESNVVVRYSWEGQNYVAVYKPGVYRNVMPSLPYLVDVYSDDDNKNGTSYLIESSDLDNPSHRIQAALDALPETVQREHRIYTKSLERTSGLKLYGHTAVVFPFLIMLVLCEQPDAPQSIVLPLVVLVLMVLAFAVTGCAMRCTVKRIREEEESYEARHPVDQDRSSPLL